MADYKGRTMRKQAGFTLVEIMISFLLGLIVVGATISIYVLTIRSSSDTIKSTRLNYDLDSVMSLMMNDIRRAGYWGRAVVGANSTANPFTLDDVVNDANDTNLQIPNDTCVLYTYDADGDGVVDANEYYGFKLNGAAIELRLTGSTTSDCDDGTWEALTISNGNEQIEITDLQFSFDPIATPNVPGVTKCLDKTNDTDYDSTCADASLTSGVTAAETRQVNIVISGRVANDTSLTKTLTNTAKVRNDRIFIQP